MSDSQHGFSVMSPPPAAPGRGLEPARPPHDLVHHLRQYARDNPGAVALWCLCVGFVLGWKLKPW
jgi:hypothetical protein